MSEFVHIRDVSLRDGLQLVKTRVLLERKLEWFRGLSRAGVPEIELTSFVSKELLPQFSDASELVTRAMQSGDAKISALCPSLNMARRAMDAGTPQINFVVSASDTHQQKNVGRTIIRSLDELDAITSELEERQLRASVRLSVSIAMSFGCSFEGRISEQKVLSLCERIIAAGVDELCLADTVGYATPGAVAKLFESAATLIERPKLRGHFHDTYGTALANITSALEVGVRRFDSTIGGLGGCPFAVGASGNVATEDCVYLLDELGFVTGISLERLVELANWVAELLPKEQLSGRVSRIGPPKSWSPPEAASSKPSVKPCN